MTDMSVEALTAAYPWYGPLRERFARDLLAIANGGEPLSVNGDEPPPAVRRHVCEDCGFGADKPQNLAVHRAHKHGHLA